MKKINLFSSLVLFLIIFFYIYHRSKIYFFKKELKILQKEILELQEENNQLESEYLYLKNLENLEEEMLKKGFKYVQKKDIIYLQE